MVRWEILTRRWMKSCFIHPGNAYQRVGLGSRIPHIKRTWWKSILARLEVYSTSPRVIETEEKKKREEEGRKERELIKKAQQKIKWKNVGEYTRISDGLDFSPPCSLPFPWVCISCCARASLEERLLPRACYAAVPLREASFPLAVTRSGMSDTFSSWYAAHPILEEFPRASHNLFHGTEINRFDYYFFNDSDCTHLTYFDFGFVLKNLANYFN